MKKHSRKFAAALALLFAVCQPVFVQATLTQEEQAESLKKREQKKQEEAQNESESETEIETETETETEIETETETETETQSGLERETGTEAQTEGNDKFLIAIDPCRQAPGADVVSEEPIGPGAEKTAPRASEGGSGCVTGQEEYDLNLQVALRLEKELKSRGYDVILTRESNETDLSYEERCMIANEAGADIMVRLYANNSNDEEVYGAHVYCPTKDSPYLGGFFDSCLNLADSIEDAYCAATGISNHGIWMTDAVAGINWCEMPVAQLEMGNLQNQYNDAYMAKDENRDTMAAGIADGIDDYFGR